MKQESPIAIKLRQNLYYVLIAVASFAALTFLPLLGTGSDVDPRWDLPTSKKAWIVFITLRLIISFLNVFIYASFINQGKLNVSDNENYKKANDLLKKISKAKGYNPRSPFRFEAKEYGWKGVTVFASTGAALVALEQALLNFSYKALLVYASTIAMAIFFGIFEMKKVELYWTVEYLDYAEREVELMEQEERRKAMFEKIDKVAEMKKNELNKQVEFITVEPEKEDKDDGGNILPELTGTSRQE